MEALKGFDINAPHWDQSTFMGRLKHFFNITDCRTVLLPDSRLDEAKALKITFLHGPLQVMMVGVFLIFMVPAACSLFPQRCSMAVSKLEPELRESIISQYGEHVSYVYFNKGL
uniref:Sideroflexin 2 n=1 Tax=Sinocyclocheilus anshuiensis TaxID=1608454 RepID=A0A671L4C5_9TELE